MKPIPSYLKASVMCHVGAGVAVCVAPTTWPWALGAVAANHLAITGAGLWPRSTWLGPNWSRLPDTATARREIAITIDDGPDPEVTPAVLDLLDAHAVRATFFAIAERAARSPALCREIVARGHSVQNHSDLHSHRFSLMGPAAMARDIGSAQARLGDACGVLPRFFRAPAGLRNPFLAPVLERFGLRLVSWTRRGFDTVRHEADGVLARLERGLGAGDILLLHDGNAARGSAGRPVVLDVLPRLLARCVERRLRPVTLPAAFASEPLTVPMPASAADQARA